MQRALILLFMAMCAYLPSPARAQPPAPAGGDMSNTTTKATGSSTARKLSDRAADTLNPFDFGAVGDGQSHPVTCPGATPPTQEADWCAMQAAINAIAAKPAVAGVPGTPGGTIGIPADTTLKLGATTLVANNISLTIVGDDQLSSAFKIGANPMLAFGLSNGRGIGSATVASTGVAFVATEQLTLTGGTCEDPPIITVNSVGPSGEILTQVVSHGGSCSVPPSNPLNYTTSGVGYGASYNGTFTGTALTGAVLIAGTGTGCANGEVLTGPGSGNMPNGQPVVPFKLTVTNSIGGVIQKGGVSVTSPGAYGTPPINPVPVTGSGACTGATFNIAALTNNGGSLTMDRLQFIADGPGVTVATAMFNLVNRSTALRDLVLVANGTNNYFSGGFDLTSMTNAVIQRIDTNNNRTYLTSNPANALFIVRQQNTLLGHFEHYWDHINAAVFMGGAIDYISTAQDTVPYQGLKFTRVGCGLGAHCLRLENAGNVAYGNVLIDDLYASQTTQQIEITKGLNVIITNGGFGLGQTRLPSPPAQADMVQLNNVNQFTLRGNSCASALSVTPSATCFHIMGTSSFGLMSANTMTNAAKVPTFNGYVFDSGATLNQQGGDYFGAFVTPVIDNGSKNTTVLSPPVSPPCVSIALSASTPTTIPDYTACVFFTNTLLASATVIMPANNALNQVISFTSFSTTTVLTVQANIGQVMGAGIPTTITPGTPFRLKDIVGRWQMI